MTRTITFIFVSMMLLSPRAWAEIPAILTDTIKQGQGVIDLFRDVTGSQLRDILATKTLTLGIDVNENAAELESSTSQGVAIKQMTLILTGSAGDVSYNDFFTNTTAMIRESGQQQSGLFHTLFGTAGSNNITSSTKDFDISRFDDVIEMRNIDYQGEITGAKLQVSFLNTAKVGDNESFFDYSGGFEQFAILTRADAKSLEVAGIGLAEAPKSVYYDIAAPSGAPEPHWLLLLSLPALLWWRKKRP